MKKEFYLLIGIVLIVFLIAIYFIYSFTIKSSLPISVKIKISDSNIIDAQLSYLISLKRDNCQTVDTVFLDNGSIEVMSEQGNANLLYSFVELYKITNNKTFLNLAEEQVKCLEGKILPLELDLVAIRHPEIKEMSYTESVKYLTYIGIPRDIEVNSWGNILKSLSDYYSIKSQNPSYLKQMADYILKNLDDEKFLKDGSLKNKAILSLIFYYNVSKDRNYLDKAKFYLDSIPLKSYEYYYPIYYEIYRRDKDNNTLNIISKISSEIVNLQNSDGSFGNIDKNFGTLIYSTSLDNCRDLLKNKQCENALIKSYKFLISRIVESPGLIIQEKTKLSETDSLLTVILIKNEDLVR